MIARAVALALGGATPSRRGYLCRCPAHQDRSPSLAVADAQDGRLLWHCFAGCSQQAVRDELVARGLLGPSRRSASRSSGNRPRWQSPRPGFPSPRQAPPPRRHDRHHDEQRCAARVRSLWREAADPRGTLAERYLNGRELELPADLCGRVLRFHPRCPFGHGEVVNWLIVPCLIAAFVPMRGGDTAPVALLRIGLKEDGTKIGKKFLGPVSGACIKLDPDEDVTLGLGLGEGLETCLAVRAAGWRPIWCCGSAGAVGDFPALAGVEALTVFGDHDENGVGQAAALRCAERWADAGREVTITHPREVGADWLDDLR